MKAFVKDLTTGWDITLLKHSTQINIMSGAVAAGAGIILMVIPSIVVMFVSLALFLILTALAILAANLTQKTIGTYDKRTHKVVPIGEAFDGPT